MNIPSEDMKLMIQEWFAQAMDYETLGEIYYAVRSESEKQLGYMAEAIAKERGNQNDQ